MWLPARHPPPNHIEPRRRFAAMLLAMPRRCRAARFGLVSSQTAWMVPVLFGPMIGRHTVPSILTPLAKLAPVMVNPLPICTLRMTVAWQGTALFDPRRAIVCHDPLRRAWVEQRTVGALGDEEALACEVSPGQRVLSGKRVASWEQGRHAFFPDRLALAGSHLTEAAHEGDVEMAPANGVGLLAAGAVLQGDLDLRIAAFEAVNEVDEERPAERR